MVASTSPALCQCLRPKNACILYDEGEYTILHLHNLIFGKKRQDGKSSHVNGSTKLLNSLSSVLVTYCSK